jgi:ectoine hydroxylase-related dioxygenase (phytanoyl-CoA dioxygenase family)
MRHPKLVNLVTDLLGPNVVGWGAHLFAKLPHDPMRVSFHQDAVYWPIHPSRGVEVWLALDDVDSGNSCMRFVRGSHLLGALAFETSSEEEKNVLNLTVRGKLIFWPRFCALSAVAIHALLPDSLATPPDAEHHGEVVDNELRAGQISLHDPMLLHGSEPNTSARRRMGLTLRYAPCNVSAELDGVDWYFKGTVVAGIDESKRWANVPRPTSD